MSNYKAPLLEMLDIMGSDMRESDRLKSHLEYDSILKKAVEDKEIIDNNQVDREELGEFYLRGFTSGEVLEGYDGTISKQGLYNKAEKIDEDYLDTHKEYRSLIQERADKYFYFDRPNMTGTMGYVRDRHQGRGYKTVYEEYMNKGGVAPMYDGQIKSDSMYFKYYPKLAKGEKLKGVSDKKQKTIVAGFYRYRKECIERAIVLGDLESIQWLNPTEDYISKRRNNVDETILNLCRSFHKEQRENPTQANILVYIEYHMEVYGEVAREYYKQVIINSTLELEGVLQEVS